MEKLDRKLFCSACGHKTNHNILFQNKRELRIPNESTLKLKSLTAVYTIVRCAGCDNVSYATIFIWDNAIKQIRVFPEEPKAVRSRYPKNWADLNKNIPSNIKDLYKQIIKSYNENFNILCGLGLRTIIEAICLELKITKGFKYDTNSKPLTQDGKKESLEGKIFGLYEQKHITWYHSLILQRIREIGNAATHELVTPTSDELYSAIDIVEKLIENIYELKDHELLK
ncbi:DUF4145 domain-containing protein [Peribacillus asahii]|uniref:DUF4145 domain-containing protein n=1 Tax=Peribacillus asahii TaxID=228899 RepID=UPI0038301BFA